MRTRRGGASGSRFAAQRSRIISVSIHTPMRGPMASTGGPSYDVTFSSAPTAEGDAITFTILASGVPNNTVMYWKNIGTTTAADFVENVNEGFVTIRGGRGSFTLTTRADNTNEGDETVRIQLYTHENVVSTGALTVPDTSLTPLYYIASSPTGVSSETDVVIFTVTTVNVANGTVLYWNNIGSTTAADFVENVNSGSITINNGIATFSLTLKADELLEGPETLRIGIYTDSLFQTNVALSAEITVPDTSSIPFTPTLVNNLFSWYDGKNTLGIGSNPPIDGYADRWHDRSGASRNLTAAAGGLIYLPRYRSDFSVQFGTYGGHIMPSGILTNSYDFFVVLKPDIGTRTFGFGTSGGIEENPLYIFGSNIGVLKSSFYQYGTLSTTSNTMAIYHVRVDTQGNPTASMNGSPYASPSSAVQLLASTRTFGGRGDSLSNAGIGRVYEYVRYHSNLTTTERQRVEGYLAWNWQLQSSLPIDHPYKNAAP